MSVVAIRGATVALVPVRGLRGAKTRLAEVLSAEAREVLTRRMLRTVVRAAVESEAVGAVVVVSPDRDVLTLAAGIGRRVIPLPQEPAAPGLNPALDVGRDWAAAHGAAALLVLFGDLPLLTAKDVTRFVGLGQSAPVVLGPDRHGTGTNALLVRLGGWPLVPGGAAPGSVAERPHRVAPTNEAPVQMPTTTDEDAAARNGGRFRFLFGPDSLARHRGEAARLGVAAVVADALGTAFDLDTPEDLARLTAGEDGAAAWMDLVRDDPGVAPGDERDRSVA